MSEKWLLRMVLPAVLLVVLSTGCRRQPVGSDERKVAVTASWLECALQDVCGDAFETVRLCPPGSCPGHFDMKPSQLAAVRECALMVRFDFQRGLDAKVGRRDQGGPRVAALTVGEGLCVPETYLVACRELAAEVSASCPDLEERCERGLVETAARLEALTEEVRRRINEAGLVDRKVLSASHQAAFARWLGLDVVATFEGGDDMTPQALADAIRRADEAGVSFVVANLQQGDRQARALAGRLGARVVVFSNFPAMSTSEATFDGLLRANLDRLLEAAAK